jgi:hypothetical protein
VLTLGLAIAARKPIRFLAGFPKDQMLSSPDPSA